MIWFCYVKKRKSDGERALTSTRALSACHLVASVRYCRMENERTVKVPVVKRFVREVLGCNCPDEVFERVKVKSGSSAVKSCSAEYEIDVGGRLLIVLTSEPPAAFSLVRLEKVILEGRNLRDARKFNRFRLIVQTDVAGEAKKGLLRTFEESQTKDDRIHLHVIERRSLPPFLKQATAAKGFWPYGRPEMNLFGAEGTERREPT